MIEPIPKGLKCFELIEIIDFDKDKAIIKTCPYWDNDSKGLYKCLFLNEECKEGDEHIKIWKMEKECNVNLFDISENKDFYFD